MRFLFVGGGTGGHLTPGIGLAEELRRRGHVTRFLCNGRSVEANYLRAEDDPHSLGIDDSRLPRPAALMRGMLRARKEARSFIPDLVMALGGAGSTAALAIAGKVPMVTIESNVVVGKSVKLLDRFAKRTFTLFPQTAADLRRGRCVGPIGRNDLKPRARDLACAQFGLAPDRPVLLVLGGSQGARDLNLSVARMASALALEQVQLLAVCGPGKLSDLQKPCQQAGLSYKLLEHCRDMGAAYSAADFVFCRGGAATMAELWLNHLPAVVVPYPYHKDRQQEHNARALEPGVEIENVLDGAAEERIVARITDPLTRRRMSSFLRQICPPDGVGMAADLMEEIAAGKA
jgi:UDP-N-acetylglucosamine--N-acetylmuramyl-(pentapeptide) pyrophosphoryl-undecaprenol N-acetylglucosamine transferase